MNIIIRGRHITRLPGPLESQEIAAEWYGEIDTVVSRGNCYAKVRIDDVKHPDFWLEVLFPVSMLKLDPPGAKELSMKLHPLPLELDAKDYPDIAHLFWKVSDEKLGTLVQIHWMDGDPVKVEVLHEELAIQLVRYHNSCIVAAAAAKAGTFVDAAN